MNYFTLFNLPKEFKIDEKLLTKSFYKLQLKFHPELFLNDSDSEKKIALKRSIEINKGYNILKNFTSRAIYLLNLNNFKIKKETLLLKNNVFLVKYFSLHEELDDLKKNNFNVIQLDIFVEKIEKKIVNYENQIEVGFKNRNYDKVIKIMKKLLFFKKIKFSLRQQHDIYLRQIN